MITATRHRGADDEEPELIAHGLARLPGPPVGRRTDAYDRRMIVLRAVLVLKHNGFTNRELATVTKLTERQIRTKLAVLEGVRSADGR